MSAMTVPRIVLGPCRCQGCGALVVWTGTEWRHVIQRCSPPECVRPLGHTDACRPTWHDRPICGAWMRYARANCARYAGHRWEHRTAYAMDNAYRAATGRERRAVAA